jgi:ribosome-associated heat shock protein Hsp15
MPAAEPASLQRADKWLHHVRVFKTRSLAAQACQKGQVTIGGQSIKAARDLRAGDVIEIERGDLRLRLRVLGLPPQRLGPPRVAEFCENLTPEEWIRRAAELRRRRELETPHAHEMAARPNKQQLRQLRAWRESNAGA